MYNFVFMLKSYRGDLHYVERLIISYNQYNKDLIPLFIVVPKDDIGLFQKFQSDKISLLAEEEVTTQIVTTEIRGIRPGYINQEIVKLTFWETKIALNYLCLDSDGVFIREFVQADFMYDESVPYTILVEDNELVAEPEYYKTHWVGRYNSIRHIQNFIGLNEKRLLTCHGFAILNSKVLQSLKINLLDARGLSYVDLLRESPYEFSWYNMWLQHDKTIPIMFREPLFKYFHAKNQHIDVILKGITQKDLARGYVGVVINSNYSRDMGLISMDGDRIEILSGYFSFREMLKLLFFKLRRKIHQKFKKVLKG